MYDFEDSTPLGLDHSDVNTKPLYDEPTAPRRNPLYKEKQEQLPKQEQEHNEDDTKIDANKELLVNYWTTKRLLQAAESNTDIPANQKAQLVNSLTAILTTLIKTQEAVYNINRLQLIENTLIDTLIEFPEVKQAFLTTYKQALQKAGLLQKGQEEQKKKEGEDA